MPNLKQAPTLKQVGKKDRDSNGWGKAIRPHELEAIIANNLSDKEFAMYKVMMFLTGNADGFKVAEKTICERCNICESGYKRARKKLVEKGWIRHDAKTGVIEVLYDNIYACGKGYTEYTSSNKQGYTESTSIIQGYTEFTPSEKQGYTESTPQGYTEYTHNNIIGNNIIRDEQYNKEEPEANTEASLRSASLIGSSSSPKEEIIGEVDEVMLDRIPTQKIIWLDRETVRLSNIPKAGLYRVKK